MVKLLEKIKKEIPFSVEKYGYGSREEFIQDALRRRILELKKMEFLSKTLEIQKQMKKKKLSEEIILKDFVRFTSRK